MADVIIVAAIEYSSEYVCVCVCVCVCVSIFVSLCVCVFFALKLKKEIDIRNLNTLSYMKRTRTNSTLGIVGTRSRSLQEFKGFQNLPQYKL